jgi:hypothetical protein
VSLEADARRGLLLCGSVAPTSDRNRVSPAMGGVREPQNSTAGAVKRGPTADCSAVMALHPRCVKPDS